MCERGKCKCGSGSGCDCCDCGCRCGCGCEGGFTRRFQTKAEQTAELEEYLNDLKTEVQAVEERLKDLKRNK